MSETLTLEQVDADGAIRETMEAAAGDTRAHFLAKAGLFGGGMFGAGALLGLAPDSALAASKGDVAILNFALTLEYLEAAFYREARRMGALHGEFALFAKVAGGHENLHVSALRKALGSKAVKSPKFNFRGTTESASAFAKTAQTLEDTGVAAYKGQAPKIKSDAYLGSALAIHAVEARHAAWIRDLRGVNPAPTAFDQPKSKRAVLAAVKGTNFIVAPKRRSAPAARPRFTG